MNRRQFLGASAAVTTGLLGAKTASFLGRNVGFAGGVVSAGSATTVPPRATTVRGTVIEFDGQSVTVRLVAQDDVESVQLLATRRGYPDGRVVAEGLSDPVHFAAPGAEATAEVVVPEGGNDAGRWFQEVFVVRDDEEPAFVCESAPYRWRQQPEYGAERADRLTDGPGPQSGKSFARSLVGNTYLLRYDWRDGAGRGWTLSYPLRRSVHEAAVDRERGYATTFDESRTNPYARDLTTAIAEDAQRTDDENGESEEGGEWDVTSASDLTESEWFDLLVRFVQGLRYARDAETMDDYDYNRTVEETLVAGVGDCKDKTHLLAGLLEAPPLSCETAMLFQPAHVVLGVAVADVPDRYEDAPTVELSGREFVPVDGALRFAVGDIPDRPITAAYGDDGWFHYDVGAIGSGLDRNVRDWFEQNVSG